MFKKISLCILILFSFTSCFSPYDKPLRISATTWIGYTPLFYAKEKGWLEPLNIKITNVVSLAENMALYQSGNFDAYVGTQYEYSVLSPKESSLHPVMMFDRSYGGDIVMGNISVNELKGISSAIDVYLEIDSINITLLKDFLKKYKLEEKKINYINKDQTYISRLQKSNIKNPTLIVTYSPYNNYLGKSGFQQLASTKEGLDLLVVDAMFTTDKVFDEHKQQFFDLKKVVEKSLSALEANPKEYYETIKAYLPQTSYEEFHHSLHDIIWINKTISPELYERLDKANFPIRKIIQ
jgi:NitT/TauT family transport system substrate-binding protein